MIHIIQNDPMVPLGRIKGIIEETDLDFHLWQAWEEDFPEEMPEDAVALLVLGGIMGADDDEKFPYIRTVCRWIKKAVEEDLPFLGICLGGQLLAKVCGGEFKKDLYGEKGCVPVDLTSEGLKDRIFDEIPSSWPAFGWHADSFIPPLNSKVLAVSTKCTFQAFKLGQNVYGVQFHPEVTPFIAADWAALSGGEPEKLEEFRVFYSEYKNISRQFLFNFFRIAVCKNNGGLCDVKCG